VIEQGGQGPQHPHRPVARHPHPVQKIRAREVQGVPGETLALVIQEILGLGPQQRLDFFEHLVTSERAGYFYRTDPLLS
jgi:hypothetical protein